MIPPEPKKVFLRKTYWGKIKWSVRYVKAHARDGAEWARKNFGDEYLSETAERCRELARQSTRLEFLNITLLVVLFLYLQGLKFHFKIFDVDVEELPGSIELLVLATSFIGLLYTFKECTRFLYVAALSEFFKQTKASECAFLIQMRYLPVLPNGNFYNDDTSVLRPLPDFNVFVILTVVASALVMLSYLALYFYTQYLGLTYIIARSLLSPHLLSIVVAFAALFNIAIISVFTLVCLYPLKYWMYENELPQD
jgi:hypothetical protein